MVEDQAIKHSLLFFPRDGDTRRGGGGVGAELRYEMQVIVEVMAGRGETVARFFRRRTYQLKHFSAAALVHLDIGRAVRHDVREEHAAAIPSEADASRDASHPGF